MTIKRDISDYLIRWKDSPHRKPILLEGARQIGKTWVMESFGADHFDYYAKFDFDRQPELKSIFSTSKRPERILKELAIFADVPLEAGKTLLIFDEIQECEEALNSLKYFYEDAPEYHILAAGSLLGVAVKRKSMTVPVGKVSLLHMYPITFREYLHTADPKTFSYVEEMKEPEHLPEVILNKLTTEYRRYLVCGGMPEAATALLDGEGMERVEQVLQDILDLYELDFSKYAEPRDIPRIRSLWHSLPSQLTKENKKFIYKIIRSGARSKDYEDALLWLEDAGMIYRIFNISKPGLPLSAYEDLRAFKVYACDCGLLRRLANLPPSTVMSSSANFTEFKGSLAENAILQSLMPLLENRHPYYWTSDNTAEVEFVIQWGERIIPIEVKAENSVSGRSLGIYTSKYSPEKRIRFSLRNLQYNDGLLSCPSPLAEWFPKLLGL